jgi:hypothetical protein
MIDRLIIAFAAIGILIVLICAFLIIAEYGQGQVH